MSMPRLSAAALAAALFAAPAAAQFVRIPVTVFRPPPVVHVPVHGVGGGGSSGGQSEADPDTLFTVIGVAVALFVVYIIVRERGSRPKASRAVVRIRSTPPGEAPEWVRAAWVGLIFPLAPGEGGAAGAAAQQVLSGAAVWTPLGYAIDAPTAVAALEAASADAARWWREQAPHAVAAGAQLIFPAVHCERMDAVE